VHEYKQGESERVNELRGGRGGRGGEAGREGGGGVGGERGRGDEWEPQGGWGGAGRGRLVARPEAGRGGGRVGSGTAERRGFFIRWRIRPLPRPFDPLRWLLIISRAVHVGLAALRVWIGAVWYVDRSVRPPWMMGCCPLRNELARRLREAGLEVGRARSWDGRGGALVYGRGRG